MNNTKTEIDKKFNAILEGKASEMGVLLDSNMWDSFKLNIDEMNVALDFLRQSDSEYGGLRRYKTNDDFIYWKHYDVRMVSYRVDRDGGEDIRYFNERLYR